MKGSLSLIALFLEWCDQAHTHFCLSPQFYLSLSLFYVPCISLAPLILQIVDAEHQTDTQINVSLSLHPPSIPCVTSRPETVARFFPLSVWDIILCWQEISEQQIADL